MPGITASYRKTAVALAVAIGAGTPFAASTAVAQDNSQSSRGLEEVVVTAQRREESLQTTPIAVSAFNVQQLKEIGVHNITDINGFVPNVNFARSSNTSVGANIFIRGIGTSETALTQDPKIGVYIDDIYVSKTLGGVFDIVDIKQMQVLRGPQGTLFGRNTTGGALLITTQKPKGEFAVKAHVSYGNFDLRRYDASVDLPSVANIATKLSVHRLRTTGWAKNKYTGPLMAPATNLPKNLGSKDDSAWRIAMEWKPIDALTVDYTYDHTNNSDSSPPSQITHIRDTNYNGFTTSPLPVAALGGQMYQQMASQIGDPHDRRHTFYYDSQSKEWLDVSGHALHLIWDANGTVFKYIFGYRKTDDGYSGADYGGAFTAPDLFYGNSSNGYVVEVPEFSAAVHSRVKMTTHEFQVIGDMFDNRLKYTGGAFYYHEDNSQGQPSTYSIPIEFLLAGAPSLRPAYVAGGFCGGGICIGTQRLPLPFADPNHNGLVDLFYGDDTRSWAIYGQASYDLTEALQLTAGGRYTNETRKAFLENESLGPRLESDHQWDNWSGMLNLSYQITSEAMVYGKVTTGFNGGIYNARATTADSFMKPAKPETVTAFEIGAKTQWFDNRLRVNVAAFRNNYSDIQTTQFQAGSAGASSLIVNAGEGTYQGFELEVTAMPVEGLTINLNYGYLDAKYNDYIQRDPNPGSPTYGQLVDISGNATVPYAPEDTASLRVKYELPMSPIGRFSAYIDANYRSKLVYDPFLNQYDSARSRTVINGRLMLSDIPLGSSDESQLEVALWGKNLTNKQYRTFGIDFGGLGFVTNNFSTPRTYGIDLTYRFN